MIKVLIVDDSALIRKLLSEIISSEPNFKLVGTASNAFKARDLINLHKPDVITLDIEMPEMDGLTFLEKLMKARPTPVIMISTLTERGAVPTLKALELGAIDYLPKPTSSVEQAMKDYRDLIIEKINLAAKAKLRSFKLNRSPALQTLAKNTLRHVIGVGASTGGTEAIKHFLMPLPATVPGIVITQHMPPGFTTSFAKRLDYLCKVTVREAQGGEQILPGHAYLAPGGLHLSVKRQGMHLVTELLDSPLVSGHKPSVDVMFSSLAQHAGKQVTAVLLTGMGKDGAHGLLDIRQAGGTTFAQDEESCVVYGMPKHAVKLGAVDYQVALEGMSEAVIQHLQSLSSSLNKPS